MTFQAALSSQQAISQFGQQSSMAVAFVERGLGSSHTAPCVRQVGDYLPIGRQDLSSLGQQLNGLLNRLNDQLLRRSGRYSVPA